MVSFSYLSNFSLVSAGALIKILAEWKHTRPVSDRNAVIAARCDYDLAFANTMLFSLLVSYHLNPHDLSLLLLPISVMLHREFVHPEGAQRSANWITVSLLAILLLPPLHVWALRDGVYALFVLPIVSLFLISGDSVRRRRVPATLQIQNNKREY